MSDIKNVKLSFSCPKTRGTLQETTEGYNCSDCSKKVIDFTNKDQNELQKIIKASDSHVCGIFKSSQLSQAFVKYAAATAIVGGSLMLPVYGQHTIKSDTASELSEFSGIVDYGGFEDDKIKGASFSIPEPIGGMEKFYEALTQHCKFPDSLKLEGRVYVRFYVDVNGKMNNVEVLNGIGSLAEKETVRAIKTFDFPFKPAEANGVPVEYPMITAISFKH
jgi:TonB family protein